VRNWQYQIRLVESRTIFLGPELVPKRLVLLAFFGKLPSVIPDSDKDFQLAAYECHP